ncbi:MAG: hypothetical protein ABFS45_07110 [Pseudomonadota bacterium]
MNLSLSKRQINRQRWRERVDAWQRSGQSQKVFCQNHQLGLASFQRWRRLFKSQEKSTDPTPVALLPVSVKQTSPSKLSVVVNDDLRIEIPADFDPNVLRQLIQVLRGS